MKGAFEEIIGKTISGVYCRQNENMPKTQIYLTFDDGTYMEIYSNNLMSASSHIDKGDIDFVRNTVHPRGTVVFDKAK